MLTLNSFICRIVDLDWRPDRVYFLVFLNPSRDNRIQPLPPGWPVSATAGELTAELDRFTPPVASRRTLFCRIPRANSVTTQPCLGDGAAPAQLG